MSDLNRFLDAQEQGYDFGQTYQTALSEIKNGEKQTHWIWYVLPQIRGLGGDKITELFSLDSLEDPANYYKHPILGARLIEICEELLKLNAADPVSILGSYIEAYKLRSCMTLFKYAAPNDVTFQSILDKYCLGAECDKTLTLLGITQKR